MPDRVSFCFNNGKSSGNLNKEIPTGRNPTTMFRVGHSGRREVFSSRPVPGGLEEVCGSKA